MVTDPLEIRKLQTREQLRLFVNGVEHSMVFDIYGNFMFHRPLGDVLQECQDIKRRLEIENMFYELDEEIEYRRSLIKSV